MLLIIAIALLVTLPLAHFFATLHKRSKDQAEKKARIEREALLEAILENSKDRIYQQ